MEKLITRQEALVRLFEAWMPEERTETVAVADAIGRVPVGTYRALYDLPLVRASAMDGVAVDAARFAEGIPDTSQWKRGTDYVRADTGDDFDDRFDAVIKIEDVTLLPSGGLQLHEGIQVTPGMNVRGPGSTLAQGTTLVDSGLPLRASDLAALVMGGLTEVEVRQKPKVAFIPTGSELIPPGTPLSRGCNYDSNSLLAFHMLREMGAQPLLLPIVPDQPELLKKALYEALEQADIVILNGGSSKGDEDYNTRLLAGEGELLFHGVSAVPGRPMSIAVIGGKPVINMAGPSLAAFYGLEWCVRPILCRCLHLPVPEKVKIRGTLTAPFRGAGPMDILCRMEVRRTAQGFSITPLGRGQADLPAMLRSNAMYISPIGDHNYQAGDSLEVELLRGPAEIPFEENA